MNLGFNPKSKTRKTYHPAAIYLFSELSDFPNMLKDLKIDDLKSNRFNYLLNDKPYLEYDDINYNLYEIIHDNLKLDDNTKILLHNDPRSIGYYTTTHIKPEYIKIISEKL